MNHIVHRLVLLSFMLVTVSGCAGTFCAVAQSDAVEKRISDKLNALQAGSDKDKAIEAAYWADFLAEVKCASEVQPPKTN